MTGVQTSFVPDDRVPGSFLRDVDGAAGKLRYEWETFHERGAVGRHIRSVIGQSWGRSLQWGVSPDRRAADVDRAALGGFDSRDQLQRLFVQAAEPIKTQLATELAGSDSAIVLCDEQGRILERAGDSAILRQTEAQNFVPGAVWNEECAGTNGIGLALSLGRPTQVFAAEHFCIGFQGYACTAAPIRHPVTREVVGVLDVTTEAAELTYHTYALVIHAARDIERQIEQHVFGRERELLERYLQGRVGLQIPFFTVDRSGRTIIQNAVAAQMLPNEDLPSVMQLVRESLKSGTDRTCDVDLALGPSELAAHIVHVNDEVIGALVTIRPLRRPQAPSSKVKSGSWEPIVGRSPAMQGLLRRAARIAELCVPVVVEGEPGTGKLALARAMHARSSRADRPSVVVNCATKGWRADWEKALSESAGAIVLLRLTALPEVEQLELAADFEVLGTGSAVPWTIGIVTLGDRPLRLELLHRVGRSTLRLPPLRERVGDVDLIVAEWRRRHQEDGVPRPLISGPALEALRAYEWPGNVRELLNTLDSARLHQCAAVIGPQDLDICSPHHRRKRSPHTMSLREAERELIERTLAQTGGNVSRAARFLGISRATLHRRLNAYRLIGR